MRPQSASRVLFSRNCRPVEANGLHALSLRVHPREPTQLASPALHWDHDESRTQTPSAPAWEPRPHLEVSDRFARLCRVAFGPGDRHRSRDAAEGVDAGEEARTYPKREPEPAQLGRAPRGFVPPLGFFASLRMTCGADGMAAEGVCALGRASRGFGPPQLALGTHVLTSSGRFCSRASLGDRFREPLRLQA